MVRDYKAAKSSAWLDVRQPEKTWATLGVLATGLLNPAGVAVLGLYGKQYSWFFGLDQLPWLFWLVSIALPLSGGALITFLLMRDGGSSLFAFLAIALIANIVAIALSGPIYTYLALYLSERIPGLLPRDLMYALNFSPIAFSGTVMRTSFTLAPLPVAYAILMLRLLMFERKTHMA